MLTVYAEGVIPALVIKFERQKIFSRSKTLEKTSLSSVTVCRFYPNLTPLNLERDFSVFSYCAVWLNGYSLLIHFAVNDLP